MMRNLEVFVWDRVAASDRQVGKARGGKVERKANREHALSTNGSVDRPSVAGEVLSTRQAADFLGISIDHVRKKWPEWTGYGVHPIRMNGKGKGSLRFFKDEIVAMLNQWQTVRDLPNVAKNVAVTGQQ